MRLTEYHGDVAVIKDKTKHKEAMEKLAGFETFEEQVEPFTAEMMEYICDNLCRYPIEVADQETLDDICTACRMDGFTNRIMNLN